MANGGEPEIIPEFTCVRTKVEICQDGDVVPVDASGVVVMILDSGRAYEVEFAESVVVTARREQLTVV